MQIDDQTVIDRVLSGESAAFAEIVEKYQRRLLGLLAHACRDRELAEDIAQEAFTRAYRKLDLFSGQSQFYTWLSRIAMNLLISNRRKKRIENQVEREGFEVAQDTITGGPSPEHELQLNETQRFVRDAVALLDEDRRLVLLMRDFDGMEYEAISEALEIPVGTVRSRLHRARLELKSILSQKANQLGFEKVQDE